jgi:hypothetical protein
LNGFARDNTKAKIYSKPVNDIFARADLQNNQVG